MKRSEALKMATDIIDKLKTADGINEHYSIISEFLKVVTSWKVSSDENRKLAVLCLSKSLAHLNEFAALNAQGYPAIPESNLLSKATEEFYSYCGLAFPISDPKNQEISF